MRGPVTSACAGAGPAQPSLAANQLDTTLKLSGSGGSGTADPGSEVELDTNRREV